MVKNVRLPPRKVLAAQSSTQISQAVPPTPHSPLSPLLPGSPLHPDGLIAPVWVRKHAELVPSVFVLFLKLWEPSTGHDDKEMEKQMDDDLVKEIAERKKRLADRGIKLTVVLMASRDMLGMHDSNIERSADNSCRQSKLGLEAILSTPVFATRYACFALRVDTRPS